MIETDDQTRLPGPGARRDRRQAEKATAVRNARLRRASVVTGGLLAVAATWALVGRPGLTLVTGDRPAPTRPTTAPSGPAVATGASRPAAGATGVTGSGSTAVDPQTAALERALGAARLGAAGFTATPPALGLGAKGLTAICGGPAPSDRLVRAAVTTVLNGPQGGGVVVLASLAVYADDGVAALLVETAKADCVDVGEPLPGYPKGSVLLRDRDSAAAAFLVAPTSRHTALFLAVSGVAEDAVVETLFTVVPGLIGQAESTAAELEKSLR